MRDEDDGEPLALQLGERAEELLDLLRHEHRCRLVEDDRASTAEEHLDDLDALTIAHADVLDHGIGVHRESVVLTDLLDPLAGLGHPQHTAASGLVSQDDVLENGEVVGELEVLVHHADTECDRVGR